MLLIRTYCDVWGYNTGKIAIEKSSTTILSCELICFLLCVLIIELKVIVKMFRRKLFMEFLKRKLVLNRTYRVKYGIN